MFKSILLVTSGTNDKELVTLRKTKGKQEQTVIVKFDEFAKNLVHLKNNAFFKK